jgi:putative membrane-bound dehydrogenase-like protein
MRPLCLLLLTASTLAAAGFPDIFNTEPTPGGPMPAEEAARTMELPPGFKCQVFAAEPDVQQPIAMTWDAKGRLWIAECYTYAENPARWNTDLRDRILIFEDVNQDGRFDKRTVFWEEGIRLTSIEVGFGGVYALCAPHLLFIPDKNGDDVPDGTPEILLDGFNSKTIGHNIVNGLRWGPDGWLYGRHGITDTSAIGAPGTPAEQRTRMNCGIFRWHPRSRAFEVVCQGGTNSWGHDWNAAGELFWINTVIGHLFHGIPGAYYDRMFGAHLNPHVYELIPQTADHYHWDHDAETWDTIRKGSGSVSTKTSTLGGGHAHVGCVIYNGGRWPAEYHDKLFTCNLHGNRINMDILERQGCGYVARHGKDFMLCKDKWFRGIDISTGPDGNVYVIDWSDAGECHDNDGVHRTSGRIYKISYEGPSAGLANNWQQRQETLAKAMRGDFPPAPAKPTVADASSPDGLTRLHAASGLGRIPLTERFPIATALAGNEKDATDRQLPLLIWYGIEPAVTAHPDQAIALALSAKIPTVRKLIARRLTEEIESTPKPVDDLLAAATGTAEATDIARGMSEALKGFSRAAKPAHWDAFAKGLPPELLRDLDLVFGSGRAVDELLALVQDAAGEANARRSALDSLLRNPDPKLLGVLKGLINDKVLGTPARLGLAKFSDPGIPALLLAKWPDRSQEWRAANVTTLSSRATWARDLLAHIESHPELREDISPYQARQIRSLGDDSLNQLLSKVWGEQRDTPEAKQKELATWKALLTADSLAKADLNQGRVLFSTVCASCHKLYGEGVALGPDLTGSDRHNLDYLLGNIIDPNALVPADYRITVLQLKDGRTLTGVLPEQNDRSLTVQTPVERLVIERAQVVSQQQMSVSLMPEGLLTALGEDNVRHLFAYLMSK